MESAGRILLMPKGDYSASATYEMLDMVNHSGASWVCKKPCTGQTPSDSNTTYWQRVGTAVDLTNYLPKTGGTVDGNLAVNTSADSYRTINLKNATRALEFALYGGGAFRLFDATNNKNIIVSNVDGTNTFNGTASGNLPLAGGTTTGDIEVSKTSGDSSRVKATVKNALIGLVASEDGSIGLYDYKENRHVLIKYQDGRCILTGTATGNLPLDGGTVSNGGMNPLSIKGADTTSLLRFYNKAGALQGYFGFINDKPVFQSNANTASELFHTGNKPTGSYTGNGSNASREINVGGIGNIVAVYSNNTLAIIGFGGFVAVSNNTVSGSNASAYLAEGKLRIANAGASLNADGVTYTYQVL